MVTYMKFLPLHKYLVIEKIYENEDALENQSQFEKAKVIRVSREISIIKEDDIIFIPSYSGDVYLEDNKIYYLVTIDEVVGKFKNE